MYRHVWCFVKYRHMRAFNVRLNLSTMLCLRLRVVGGEVIGAVLLQQSLNRSIKSP